MLCLSKGGTAMMTVNEVSKLTGVSVRTLQYYDRIGLLHPAKHTESGYRLYDNTSLEKLQQILLFRELEFSLKDIKAIISSPDFDKSQALEQQIALLTLKKEHLENLILMARGIKLLGVNYMNFKAFDTTKLDEYSKRAKEQCGKSDAYREYEEKSKNRTKADEQKLSDDITRLFAEFGEMKDLDPASREVQRQVARLQQFVTDHCYTCTSEILSALGQMYAGGGDFTHSIDAVGGAGTAVFSAEAIRIYCENNSSGNA
jgi:DNA-binding transcriptional MerR regulator